MKVPAPQNIRDDRCDASLAREPGDPAAAANFRANFPGACRSIGAALLGRSQMRFAPDGVDGQ